MAALIEAIAYFRLLSKFGQVHLRTSAKMPNEAAAADHRSRTPTDLLANLWGAPDGTE